MATYSSVAPPLSLLDEGVDVKNEATPNGVNKEHWLKFQELRMKKEEMDKRSQAQSQKRTNKLIKKTLNKVNKSLSPDDQKFISSMKSTSPNTEIYNLQAWKEIVPYMNANPQLRSVHHGRFEPKTALDLELEKLIKERKFDEANELNEKLTKRNTARDVVKAIKCKRYNDQKQEEEEALLAKKKPRLNWGFDSKERWERKGNM
eukprot:TRINITY_DN2842_c0_g1_i1.p1 TRINITY_DN2842_c0_g1~~TRINITY_DN2842_c0_g1_i1.p1  ORF type:complete len:204 (-),score=56.85 TRINITY_DN2842_c0_g1_i1:23-634(-)